MIYENFNNEKTARSCGIPWKGDKVVFYNEGGWPGQAEDAAKFFKTDQEYEVEETDIHSSISYLKIVGFKGRWNSVMFGPRKPERKKYTFISEAKIAGDMGSHWRTAEIKDEPMFFNCDAHFAWEHGGPITRKFIYELRNTANIDVHRLVIDTRVHMLMPGWYPAIPGWHHDDVIRSRPDGQPNYDDPKALLPKHAMALVNGDICPTQFALGKFELDEVLPGEGPVYKKWHDEIQIAVDARYLTLMEAPANALILFDAATFHQGVAARKNGWRWFGRASWHTDRVPTNEIRRQVQVYMENPTEGW